MVRGERYSQIRLSTDVLMRRTTDNRPFRARSRREAALEQPQVTPFAFSKIHLRSSRSLKR